MKRSGSKENLRKNNPRTTALVLAATAVVVMITIYVATRRPEPPTDNTRTQLTTENEEAKVLRLVSRMLGDVAAMPPAQRGPALKLALNGSAEMMGSYVKHNPADVNVRVRLADVFEQMGRLSDANQLADEALARQGDNAEALCIKAGILRRQGVNGYLDYYRRAALSPGASASIWSKCGLAMLAGHDADSARTLLAKAVAAGAKDALTLSCLADMYSRAHDPNGELPLRLEAVKDPRAGAADWYCLAVVQDRLNQLPQAGVSVEQALTVPSDPARPAPEPSFMQKLLGEIRQRQGSNLQAAEAFAAASEDQLLRADASYQAAKCYYAAKRYGLAMKYVDLAFEMQPADPNVAQLKRKIEDARFPTTAPAK